MEVPTATSLRDIYPEDAVPVQAKRWESLLSQFKELYGKQAEFVARSPGRVNIIGEVKSPKRPFALSELTNGSTLTILSTRFFPWRSLPTSLWL
jgi:hypothetical protein